jgi:hypothetical protein
VDTTGACIVQQRVLYYVVSQSSNVFWRNLELDSEPAKSPESISLDVFRGPLIGESDSRGMNSQLFDELAKLPECGALKTSIRLFSKMSANISLHSLNEDPSNLKRVHYRIDTHGSVDASSGAFALFADFKTSWMANAFHFKDGESDSFFMNFACPCYRYRLTIDFEPACKVQISDIEAQALCSRDPHWGEQERLRHSLIFSSKAPQGLACELKYPFPGTTYRFDWKIRKTS